MVEIVDLILTIEQTNPMNLWKYLDVENESMINISIDRWSNSSHPFEKYLFSNVWYSMELFSTNQFFSFSDNQNNLNQLKIPMNEFVLLIERFLSKSCSIVHNWNNNFYSNKSNYSWYIRLIFEDLKNKSILSEISMMMMAIHLQ